MGWDISICSPVGIKKAFSLKTNKKGEFSEDSKPEDKPEEAKDIKRVSISGKLLKPDDTSISGVLTFNGKPTKFPKTKAKKSVDFGKFELKDKNQFSIEGVTDPAAPDTALSFEVEIYPCS